MKERVFSGLVFLYKMEILFIILYKVSYSSKIIFLWEIRHYSSHGEKYRIYYRKFKSLNRIYLMMWIIYLILLSYFIGTDSI